MILASGIATTCQAQFHPPAGEFGSHAIAQSHALIESWASCHRIDRGWQDISDTSLGRVTVGDSASASGPADGDVLSLGDGGTVVVQFNRSISDREGYEFAVFENSFRDDFLELAFVEVSSDGVNFLRFPATSNTQSLTQIEGFDLLDASQLNNLAGKYRAGYGVPFDLSELPPDTLVDIDSIRFLRLVDVVGSIDPLLGSVDAKGNLINDPFPTPFPSGGFDLDAVALLMPGYTSSEPIERPADLSVYPNPTQPGGRLNVTSPEPISSMHLLSIDGRLVYTFPENSNPEVPETISKGCYILKVDLAHSSDSQILELR